MRALSTVVRSVLLASVGLLLLGDRVALAAESGLALELHPAKPAVVLGEPVYVTAVMRNRGPASVTVAPVLSLEASRLRYWVEDPKGKVRRYETWVAATIEGTPQRLYPGDEITATDMVWWQPRTGCAFPTPGDYGLTATFGDGRHSLRSHRVVLRVVSPRNEDATALPLILGKEQGEFLQVGSYQFQEGMKKLRELVAKHPRSTYAPYAEYALALRASRKGWFCPKPGSGQLDRIPPDYPQAITGFQQIVRDHPDCVVADDAQYELARTHRDSGDQPAARQALQRFLEVYAATSDRLPDAVTLSEELDWEHTSEAGALQTSDWRWIPLDKALAGINAAVTWPLAGRRVSITRRGTALGLEVGCPVATLGSRRLPLFALPTVQGDRMLVPESLAPLLSRVLKQSRQWDPLPARQSRGREN